MAYDFLFLVVTREGGFGTFSTGVGGGDGSIGEGCLAVVG